MCEITTFNVNEQLLEDFTKLGDVLQCNQTGEILLFCCICSTTEKFVSLDDLQQHHVSVHANFDLDSSEEQRNEKTLSDHSRMSAESNQEDFEYSSIDQSDIKLEIEQTYDDNNDGDNRDIFANSDDLSCLENEETKRTNKIQCSCCPGESYACIGVLKDHLFITQNLEAYPCDRCSGLFFNKTELTSHQNMHDQIIDDSGSYVHKCQYCGTIFEQSSDLQTHLLSTYEGNVANSHNSQQHDNNDDDAMIEESHSNESEHNPESEMEDSDFTPNQIENETKSNQKVRTKHNACLYCGKIYRTKENLIQHERSHTGEKPFQCNICSKRYNHSSYLNIHLRIHTNDKPYKCSCGKAFISRSKLTAHEKNHQNIRPHACKQCSKTFRTPSDLRDHFRSEHTDERPFVCTVANCTKSFAKYKLLQQHKNLHTPKKYKCFFCDMKFSQLAGRYGHEKRVHSA